MKRHLYLAFPTLFLVFIAYLIQTHLFLNGDVGYQLHAASELLKGGKYAVDFFENNPPMILYLYSPVNILVKLFTFDIITTTRCYIIFLILLSLSCSAFLIKRIISEEHTNIAYIFYYTLVFVFLFLPVYDFGQREHLLLILMVPYLLAAALVLQQKTIHPLLAFLIGVSAALGFGMKPFFLFPLIFIELYLVYLRRSVWGWVRVETVTCLIVLIVYVGSIFLFQPTYWQIILPLNLHWYFLGSEQTWLNIFSHFMVIYCFMAVAYYFISAVSLPNRELLRVLLLALIGAIFAFIIPHNAWHYHVFPAFGIALLLTSLIWVQSFLLAKKEIKKIATLSILSIFIFLLPLSDTFIISAFWINDRSHGDMNKLAAYLNSQPSAHSLYCLTANSTKNCFPLVYLTHGQFGGRYPLFWWLNGLLKTESLSKQAVLPVNLVKDKQYFIDTIADDLNLYRAQFIVINTVEIKQYQGEHFDMIAYLSQDRNFQQAWKPYRYFTTVGRYQIFKRNA